MPQDVSPEEIAARQDSPAIPLTLDEAILLEDVGAQISPEDLPPAAPDAEAAAELSHVKWPASDEEAPDYRYVAKEQVGIDFVLTPEVLDALIRLNSYEPHRQDGLMAFALRGAQLTSGHEIERADRVSLKQVRPDHRTFRCVIGFYHLADRKLSAYTGSTVPCRLAVYSYVNGGESANMLPTGLWTYYVWRHKNIRPALRLAYSASDPEKGSAATVLRNKNNYQLDVSDTFDPSTPYDNVHCSYFLSEDARLGASFSSWGCLTVRGTPSPSAQWAKFQSVLDGLGPRKRVDLLLATGKDAAMCSLSGAAAKAILTALRPGSRGEEVRRLQEKLGVSVTGYFAADTADKYTSFQRTFLSDAGQGRIADGLFTRAIDEATGWNVFSAGSA